MARSLSICWRVVVCGAVVFGYVNGDDTEQAVVPIAYQRAPEAIRRILDAPPTPFFLLSPDRKAFLLAQGVRYPPIADLARPMLQLAGLRIDPITNGGHAPSHYVGVTLNFVDTDIVKTVVLPPDARIGSVSWSPDSQRFAFTNTTDRGIEIWVADGKSGRAQRVPELLVNATYGAEFQWMPDGATLLCQAIPAGRGSPPRRPEAPTGPIVQESSGRAGPVRTYQDLLDDPVEEILFDYYVTSQLVLVDTRTNRTTAIGKPAIFASAEPSPDGKHLLVDSHHRPYSYLLPVFDFPRRMAVWDLNGQEEYLVADLPLADRVPIEGVPVGPRNCHWQPTEPATLVWVEALDDGDPRRKVAFRDQIRLFCFPFEGTPQDIVRTEHRFAGLTWADRDQQALLREYDRDRRWLRTHLIRVDGADTTGRVLWDRSIRDRYGDPGSPLMRTLPSGHRVMWQDGTHIFLAGDGSTPKGDRPFLDRLDLATMQSERWFQCDDDSYESVVTLAAEDGTRFISRYETPAAPPNYYIRKTRLQDRKPLTQFEDPAPELRSIRKTLVTYERADGVQLSFTLYLPPGARPDERFPTVVWAYPREFSDPGTAGQVSGSTNRFTMLGGTSHLFMLMAGYAVLDAASMPVVGDPETMNDTYVTQIVTSAQAAIDKAVEMGVTDRDRVGVGGHSYGAFMTANLLAHCDLFRAGIARSGAYNRTLTPFGFQSERRTLWEAPDTYMNVSPLMAAHKINEPLLLIHGEADNNAGTFPIQSERMYQAVRGNGGTVRFVLLPHESHGYAARESIEHTLHEMISWFDRHVKSPRAAPLGTATD